jgi:hypothetical protein
LRLYINNLKPGRREDRGMDALEREIEAIENDDTMTQDEKDEEIRFAQRLDNERDEDTF